MAVRDMGASKDRSMAALKRAYALAVLGEVTSATVRKAQRHAKANHPDWAAFVGSQAIEAVKVEEGQPRPAEQVAALAVKSPLLPENATPPDFIDLEDAELSDPEKVEKVQWQIWEFNARQWKYWAARNDNPQMALAFSKTTLDARKAYNEAREAREAWEIENRRVIPTGDFHAYRMRFLIPLRNLLDNLPNELAKLVNPQDPEFARREAESWKLDRLQPQIQQLIDGVDELQAA